MPGAAELARKTAYSERVISLLENHESVLFVHCDNIGSSHMQTIRKDLRGKAVLLMGKNTIIRRAIRNALKADSNGVVRGLAVWEALLPQLVGNVGLVFTNSPLDEVQELVLATRVPAAAKTGAVAPNTVLVPKGPTTLPPTKTSFFAALDIATKISRGTVELIADVTLIEKGQKVGSSEAALLQMLDIRPFTYGMVMKAVYSNGFVFDAELLSINDDDVVKRFSEGVNNVACLSLALGVPTVAAFPHVVMDAYKNLLAIALETTYVFPLAETVKEMVENPDAFVVASATTTDNKEETKEDSEEEEESDEGGFGDMFGF